MCAHDDPACLRLAEDPHKPHDRETAGVDDVPENIPRPHAGQLVDIPDHDQRHAVRHSLQEIVHEHDIDHGAFVQNQDIPVERGFFVPLVPFRGLYL